MDQEIIERLDRLQGTRRLDRFMQWVAGVAGAIVTAAIVGLVVSVIDLKNNLAVSNAELKGSIDRLSDKLDAGAKLSDTTVEVLRGLMGTQSITITDHEARLRMLETRPVPSGPR